MPARGRHSEATRRPDGSDAGSTVLRVCETRFCQKNLSESERRNQPALLARISHTHGPGRTAMGRNPLCRGGFSTRCQPGRTKRRAASRNRTRHIAFTAKTAWNADFSRHPRPERAAERITPITFKSVHVANAKVTRSMRSPGWLRSARCHQEEGRAECKRHAGGAAMCGFAPLARSDAGQRPALRGDTPSGRLRRRFNGASGVRNTVLPEEPERVGTPASGRHRGPRGPRNRAAASRR